MTIMDLMTMKGQTRNPNTLRAIANY